MRKAISVIEIQILLVLIIVVLFGFSFLIKFIQENMWIVYSGILFIIILVAIAYSKNQEEKKCKKCFSQNTSLIDSEDRIIGWKYMTKKGLPDKRRNNNKAKHLLKKRFECSDCKHIFEIEMTY